MARKQRRRTSKRGGSVIDKMKEGVQGWKDIGANVKAKAESGAQGMREAAHQVQSGYQNRTRPGGMLAPIPGPPATPPPMGLPMQPTKEKEAGGLLGLGWFGLGGRRLSHSSFINKMLRVRSKTKRNKAIRKYLKGGKKKTKKRRRSKKRRTRRRRR